MRTKIFILLITAFFPACQTLMNDEQAIQALLEKESATWRSGDFQAHADCWHIQPYSKILVSSTSGKTYDVPPQAMKDPNTKMGNGGRAILSNLKMSINGTTAWVNHDELSIAADGSNTYSHEIRLLEKVDGSWKLVAQSIHAYEPE